jgi:hypothetical protein
MRLEVGRNGGALSNSFLDYSPTDGEIEEPATRKPARNKRRSPRKQLSGGAAFGYVRMGSFARKGRQLRNYPLRPKTISAFLSEVPDADLIGSCFASISTIAEGPPKGARRCYSERWMRMCMRELQMEGWIAPYGFGPGGVVRYLVASEPLPPAVRLGLAVRWAQLQDAPQARAVPAGCDAEPVAQASGGGGSEDPPSLNKLDPDQRYRSDPYQNTDERPPSSPEFDELPTEGGPVEVDWSNHPDQSDGVTVQGRNRRLSAEFAPSPSGTGIIGKAGPPAPLDDRAAWIGCQCRTCLRCSLADEVLEKKRQYRFSSALTERYRSRSDERDDCARMRVLLDGVAAVVESYRGRWRDLISFDRTLNKALQEDWAGTMARKRAQTASGARECAEASAAEPPAPAAWTAVLEQLVKARGVSVELWLAPLAAELDGTKLRLTAPASIFVNELRGSHASLLADVERITGWTVELLGPAPECWEKPWAARS